MATERIRPIRTVSGAQPVMARRGEKLSQTFKAGAPVEVDVSVGYVMVWDGTTVANKIAGIAAEDASNLSASNTAQTLSFGSVPNQSSASNIPRGAPLNDGRIGFFVANQDTVFYGQVGPAQTTAAINLDVPYGLTVDSDGHWYVDTTKTNTSTETVVRVIKLDTIDTTRGVHFVFLPGASQQAA